MECIVFLQFKKKFIAVIRNSAIFECLIRLFFFLLALKIKNGKYIINGHHKLSQGSGYKAAGTTFEYHRPMQTEYWKQREHIYAKGPLNETVVAMVGKQFFTYLC